MRVGRFMGECAYNIYIETRKDAFKSGVARVEAAREEGIRIYTRTRV